MTDLVKFGSQMYDEYQKKRQLMLEIGTDLGQVEEETVAFAAKREQLGVYSADAAAIIDLANRQVQLVQMLRRVAGLIG